MSFAVIAIPFLIKLCSRWNIHVKWYIDYINFIPALWSLSAVLNSFGMFKSLKRGCSFAKIDISLQGHIQAVFGSCFEFFDKDEEIQRVSDDREPWKTREETETFAKKVLKNCVRDQFQPKFDVNITFPFIKISQSTLQRTLRKECFIGCRQRKTHLLQDLQDMRIKVRLYFVNRQLDKDVKFCGHQYRPYGETRWSCKCLGHREVAFVWRKKVKLSNLNHCSNCESGWWKLDVLGIFLGQCIYPETFRRLMHHVTDNALEHYEFIKSRENMTSENLQWDIISNDRDNMYPETLRRLNIICNDREGTNNLEFNTYYMYTYKLRFQAY